MEFINTGRIHPNLSYTEGIQINNLPATVRWQGEIWNVRTRLNRTTESYKFIRGTFNVEYHDQLLGRRILRHIIEIVMRYGNIFYRQCYLRCNCHGFSLLGRAYWLNDPTKILEDEYMPPFNLDEIENNVKYVVTWHDNVQYSHSGIYLNGMVWHKKNVRNVEYDALEVVNAVYPNDRMQFWRLLG